MSPLAELVGQELGEPVDPRVAMLAEAVARRHGAASCVVLFYGSCLREAAIDGLMLDFYLIVRDYREAFPKAWMAAANRLLPPNVFPIEADGMTAKYAVLSEADFARMASSATHEVSVWARFAQPARIAWAANAVARRRAIEAVAGAAPALLAAARPMLADSIDAQEIWRQAFALTYGAELRAERRTRGASVVDADPARYRAFLAPALAEAGLPASIRGGMVSFADPLTAEQRKAGARAWAARRRKGKLLTLARLAKATGTYAGGIDYIAWKINRHAGTNLAVSPWQRRHPILGALTMLPRLIAKGAIR